MKKIVWNYKLQDKLPTKKECNFFVKNLPPHLKEYTPIKWEEMPKTNYEGRVYNKQKFSISCLFFGHQYENYDNVIEIIIRCKRCNKIK